MSTKTSAGTYDNQRRMTRVLSALLALAVAVGIVGLPNIRAASGNAADTAPAPHAQGRASISILWPLVPTSAHPIPASPNSVAIRLTAPNSQTVLASALLTRPTGGGKVTVTFDHVDAGDAMMTAIAYPKADGTGVAQSKVNAALTVSPNQTASVNITPSNPTDTVSLSPATASVTIGRKSAPLIPTPTDSSGNVVLTDLGAWHWYSLNPKVATVDSAGVITAKGIGNATIAVTETKSGKSATAAITVTPVARPEQSFVNKAVIYDGFAYTPGQSLAKQNGGAGWSTDWRMHGPGTASTIVANSLTYKNLRTSGNAFETTSDQPIGDDRTWTTPIGSPGQVAYFSELLKPLDAMNAGPSGQYFGFGLGGAAFGKIVKDIHLGIFDPSNNQSVVSDVVATQNTTYFLVARITFGATNSKAELFINPTPGAPLPSIPDATMTVKATSLTYYSSGANIHCTYDEFRAGNAYSDVAPTQ